MITWQTILQFLLKNWKGVLIVLLGLTVMGKMRYDYKQMQAAYEASEQSLQAQLAGRQFSQDPEELAETIMLMYGFDYVP